MQMFSFYKKLSDIPNPKKGESSKDEDEYLYFFNTDYYYNDFEEKLPENTIKFGRTVGYVKKRLNTYNNRMNKRNIEFVKCKYSTEREYLLKHFLSNFTNLLPVKGQEYYVIKREYLKYIIKVIVLLDDNEVLNIKDNSSDINYLSRKITNK